MVEAVTSSLTTVISWVGSVVDALVKTDGALSALLPLLAVSVAVSALMLGIRAIRGFIWGA